MAFEPLQLITPANSASYDKRGGQVLADLINETRTRVNAVANGATSMRQVGRPVAGQWITPATGTPGTTTPGNGNAQLAAMFLTADAAVDLYRYEVTTAGSTGSTARVVVHADDGAGQIGTLVYDGGQEAADAVATVERSCAGLILPAGLLWVGLAPQNGTPTAPVFRSIGIPNVQLGTISTVSTAVVGIQYVVGTTTQAAPLKPPAGTASGGVPRVIFRLAA